MNKLHGLFVEQEFDMQIHETGFSRSSSPSRQKMKHRASKESHIYFIFPFEYVGHHEAPEMTTHLVL